MTIPETKVTIRTATGSHEFSESDFLEKPADGADFVTLRSPPFDGWETAYSLDISPAYPGFEILMLAIGKHVRTNDGLAFRVSNGVVTAYRDING
ncbi:hypothetical protein [Pseudomonas protegens]|uniref:hypothetical protein n=1 Tax=Pseudomonas protegens TaxID=380021 RepID=UPI00383A5B0B